MKIFLKIVAGLIGVLVLLIVVAVLVLPRFFDPNDYKDQITAGVKEHTGRDLTIAGDIRLSVFPWLGVDLGALQLSNAEGFAEPVFARTEKVALRVKLIPLLSERVEMDKVVVHGLVLNLARDANGHTNWDDLAGEAERGERREHRGEGPPIEALAIGGLDIRDANITWDDALSGQKYAVRNMDVKTDAMTLGKPIGLDVDLDVEGGEPRLSGHVSLEGELAFDPDRQTYEMSGLVLAADLTGESLPGGKANVRLAADALFDGESQSFQIVGLNLGLLDLEVTGNLTANQLDRGGALSGALKVSEFDPKGLMKALGQPPIETSDAKALTRVSLEAGISGNADAVTVKPVVLVLDDSTLKGEVGVSNFAHPAITFDFDLDAIDVDRYLPPPAEEEAGATPAAAASSAGELPLEQLRALDVDGSFRAGRIKVAKLTVTDFSADIKAEGGQLGMAPMAARLYDGKYAGKVLVDVRGDQPVITLDEDLTGIQAGPLLRDLRGSEPLVGTGNVDMNLKFAGTQPESVKKTLNGNVAFSFTDGAINGVNVAKMIRDAKARILGGSTGGDAPARTDFAELSGTVRFKDGLGSNDDLVLKSPLLRVGGAGTADLPSETIDYRLKTTVVATTEGQGGKELTELAGVTVPIKVGGTFKQPKFNLDVEALASAIAKSKAGELVGGAAGGLGEAVGGAASGAGEAAKSVGEGVGSAVEGLLGGGEKEEEGGGLLDGLLGD